MKKLIPQEEYDKLKPLTQELKAHQCYLLTETSGGWRRGSVDQIGHQFFIAWAHGKESKKWNSFYELIEECANDWYHILEFDSEQEKLQWIKDNTK